MVYFSLKSHLNSLLLYRYLYTTTCITTAAAAAAATTTAPSLTPKSIISLFSSFFLFFALHSLQFVLLLSFTPLPLPSVAFRCITRQAHVRLPPLSGCLSAAQAERPPRATSGSRPTAPIPPGRRRTCPRTNFHWAAAWGAVSLHLTGCALYRCTLSQLAILGLSVLA